jgi:hypothetical protein
MSLSFYSASVISYLQTLRAVVQVLERGQLFASETDQDVEAFLQLRLRDDMLPLTFQVRSVCHHSKGAIEGMRAGVFTPPPPIDPLSYNGYVEMVREAIAFLEAQSEADINALSGRDVVFRLGEREMPFTTDNFLQSFSLPNFYFHAATTYGLLRQQGVPLSKIDFLGQLRLEH